MLGQVVQIDIRGHKVGFHHLLGVNFQDLQTTRLVSETNLDVHLKTTRTQQSLVDQLFAIGHTNHQNVVQLLDTVHLGQQLRKTENAQKN
jgi:hypothetical protein